MKLRPSYNKQMKVRDNLLEACEFAYSEGLSSYHPEDFPPDYIYDINDPEFIGINYPMETYILDDIPFSDGGGPL